MSDQDYSEYEDESVPGAEEAAETWEEVDPIEALRAEMRAELAGFDARQEQRQQQFSPQQELSMEDAYALYWQKQQEIIEHHIGRGLTSVEIAGMNHISDQDPNLPISDVYRAFKALPVAEKARLAHAEMHEEQEAARMEEAFKRGDVVPPEDWSDDLATRRDQRVAWATAKAQGWVE